MHHRDTEARVDPTDHKDGSVGAPFMAPVGAINRAPTNTTSFSNPARANVKAYTLLGRLMECPADDLAVLLEEGWGILRDHCPEAAASLAQFQRALGDLSGSGPEEAYLRAFDVAPLCAPYVSIHLFGEENYRRGEFMARLLEIYAREGFDPGRELPDHLSVLLKYASKAAPEERRELLEFCLKGPVTLMRAPLERSLHPYRFLLCALAETIENDLKKEACHA